MSYFVELDKALAELSDWLALRKEQGAGIERDEANVLAAVRAATERLKARRVPAGLAKREPSALAGIKVLRPRGPRRMNLNRETLYDKLLGAWFGRAAGCALGIPCEGMSKDHIRQAAKSLGMRYPLAGYWKADPKPQVSQTLHYKTTPRRKFLAGHIDRIGADDDLIYTELGLLILEEYGPDFTVEDLGAAWVKYLAIAWTAERVALDNLLAGFKPPVTAVRNNPYVDFIGADIRSDPWAYAAPAWPEKAAEFAHRDASLSHLATGIHGEMFFSAAISAAFAVKTPVEALEIGLTEIPRDCRLARAVKSALAACRRDGDWDKTTDRILKKYDGMSMAHTLNNAELTVAGLYYGGGDFGRTIALTVMGGVDTDCTGATAGSIMGAILGAKGLPKKWTKPFGNRVESYIKGKRNWRSSDIARRFGRVALRIAERK